MAFLFGEGELLEQQVGIGMFEIIGREFLFGAQEDIAIAHARPVEVEIVDVLDPLDIHR